MDDLVAFVRARLDEDELWAKAASAPASVYIDQRPVPPDGAHWTWAVGENWTPYRVNPLEEYVGEGAGDYAPTLTTVEQWPSRYGPDGRTHPNKVLQAEEIATGIGGHVARHDPARVLRDVAATRQLLAYLIDLEDKATDNNWWNLDTALPFKLLALPYAEHPDYRPEWAA